MMDGINGITSNWIWSIGTPDGSSHEIIDNFKTATQFGEAIWDVSEARRGNPQVWPMYHPSEADPEAGYRTYTHTVLFPIDEVLPGRYKLRFDVLEIVPRLASLSVRINGTEGTVYFHPKPSQSGEIRLQSGLHTTIYSEDTAEIMIPSSLLRTGVNRLELTAVDGQEFVKVERIEAIKRLDRMANGSGLLYRFLAFGHVAESIEEVPPVRFRVHPTPAYRRTADGVLAEQCHCYVELEEPIQSGTMTLSGGGAWEPIHRLLPAAAFGHLHFPFEAEDGEGPVSYFIEAEVNGHAVQEKGAFERRRKWKVYITPHAHTDIGYTHRQYEVAERLCRNVDFALDRLENEVCGEGEGRPVPFTYHLDSSWALEQYLATRSEQRKEQLLKWIKARRIGLAGNYVDLLTQFAGLEDLIRNGEFTESVLRPHGLSSNFASVVDVASITGSFPAVLEGSGIRYLVHANNQDRGPFRLNGGLHRISPFYWEGTSGGRVLCWLAKMYCELRKVCGSPPLVNAAERGLDMWLQEYETGDYAPDAVLLYGQEADNTDMDPQPIDFVKQWNDTYEYPKLIACDVSEFFEYVEANFGPSLHTVKGDGGAYWEDGEGSSISETIEARFAQAALPAAERLESLAVVHNADWRYPAGQYDDAWRELLLYVEHTWGAFLSASEPDALLQRDQWEVKSHMARSSKQWAKRLLLAAATRHSLNWNNNGREVVVYNPHSWKFSGPVQVEIAPNEQLIDEANGQILPLRELQVLPTQRIVELWAEQLPALSYRRYVLQPMEQQQLPAPHRQMVKSSPSLGPVTLENDYYRLKIDPLRACAISWLDKDLNRELIDETDAFGLGQFLYVQGGEGTRLLSNQSDLAPGNPEILADFTLTEYELTRSSIGTLLVMRGEVPYGQLEVEWLLRDTAKQFEVGYRYDKKERREKEAVYVAFPTALTGAAVSSDSQLGWVNWQRDQLPGGCKEWLPLQTGVLAENTEAAVFIASPDIPLFCIGDIVRGDWPIERDMTGGRLFSYVLNNYWHTNYKGSQGGHIEFRYKLTSGLAIPKAEAYRFGWESRQPMYAQRMSFQDFRMPQPTYSGPSGGPLALLDSETVILSTIKAARWAVGLIVRFQEISGQPGEARLGFPNKLIKRAWKTDLLERELEELSVNPDGSLDVEAPAWGLMTVRIELA